MNNLSPYGSADLLPSDARRAGRAVSRYQTGGQLRTAQVDVDTDVAIGKAEAVTAVTGAAMANVVRVAQAQRHLEQLAPEASGRLALLADDHALTMADVCTDHRRAVRRR